MPTEDQNQNTQNVDASLQSPAQGRKKVLTAVAIVVVVIVVLAAVWLTLSTLNSDQTSPIPSGPSTSSNQDQAVKDAGGVEKLEKEVNDTDVDALSKDLDSNDKDAAEF